MRHLIRLAALALPWTIVSFHTAQASVETNSSAGIDSDSLPLDGTGISIGQVEFQRPGKFNFDSALNSNFGTIPTAIFLLDDRIATEADRLDEIYDLSGEEPFAHATVVAGVMISKDFNAPGVARNAKLYASAGDFPAVPAIPEFDSLAISSQFIATRDDGKVRAINLSFGVPFEPNGTPDGNSKYTEFVDWSASALQHDVLYVVAGSTIDKPGRSQPTDNYNGMTVAESEKVSGVYRKVASDNDFTDDAVGSRTSISLIAPGIGVEVADVGGPAPPTVVNGTSYAAPQVVGTVALLQQHAERQIMLEGAPRWTENARRHEVMKSVLMNSADKIDGVLGSERTVLKQNGVDDWLDSNAFTDDMIPLDIEMGVGHLNAKRAFQQFDPGEFNAGGVPVPAIGWDYGFTQVIDDIQTYALAEALPVNQYVSLTLAWDRDVLLDLDFDGDGEFDEGDEFLDFSMPTDLNLYLMPAGATSLGQSVARSIATDTSVEHIFFQVPNPGMYEIWVEQATSGLFGGQNYALAWMTATPPELVFGDYDGNGTVGPEDYDVWKSNFGTSFADADGNGDGTVNAADYTVWRNNLGAGAGSGSAASVPEPWSGLILALGVAACWSNRRGVVRQV